MIKTGVRLTPKITSDLFRLLVKHPDIELKWISGPKDFVSTVVKELPGELDAVPNTENFEDIDLYIGPDTTELEAFINSSPETKAIIIDDKFEGTPAADEASIAVCEYNRKALVRGARITYNPCLTTLLGALALMPLAKNLMLNAPIYGNIVQPESSILPARYALSPGFENTDCFEELKTRVLKELQTSFNAPIYVNTLSISNESFACATFSVEIKISEEHLKEIFHKFYDDHRHIFFSDSAITDRMVMGTNKTVITLSVDGNGRPMVCVAFDARLKGSAGNVVHALNLLFGLDELTGL